MSFASCGKESQKQELHIFVAASLGNVIEKLKNDFETEHQNIKLSFHSAGSQLLARQILEGAPADIFIPAHPSYLDKVAEKKTILEKTTGFQNRLVFIVRKEKAQGFKSFNQLHSTHFRIVLGTPEVPVGIYARQALNAMGLLEAIQPQVVSEENNVKLVLTKVLLAEADAGIVYASDLGTSVREEVVVFEFPQEAAVKVTYPIAIFQEAQNIRAARLFKDYLLSETTQRYFFLQGFRKNSQ